MSQIVAAARLEAGEKIPRGFVIARGDHADLAEFTVKILDQVTRLVELPVKPPWRQAAWPRRDHN